MRTLILALCLAALCAAQPVKIGKGCTTAYFIDNDCDGYGVAVRVDGDYITQRNNGDKPDADDNDPTVNTVSSWRAKYGSGAGDTTNATLLKFLTATRGYTASRVWWVATTGDNTDCSTAGNYTTTPGDNMSHPCANMGPMAAAWHNNPTGALVVWRGGTYSTGLGSLSPYANYYPHSNSASTPFIIMSYPGESAVLSSTSTLLATDLVTTWPTNGPENVIVDGFVFKNPTSWAGDAVSQNDTKNWVFRNNEFTGWADGIRNNDHNEDILIEKNVFHDNPSHSIYFGNSSPTAVPTASFGQTLGADFDFAQDAINYTNGDSKGATYRLILRDNLDYRNGGGGTEPFHINAIIDDILIEGNIIHSGPNSTALGFQTGVYNAVIRNNLIFNTQGGCAITWSFYGTEAYHMATHRYHTVTNNTLFAGTSVTDSGGNSGPSCGLYFNNYSYDYGVASVTSGSSTVTWVSGMPFQSYWTAGDSFVINNVAYTISSVAEGGATLTLTTNYAGSTNASADWFTTHYELHTMKDFTIKNNIIVANNWSNGSRARPFAFCAGGHPETHTFSNNIIWNNSLTNPFTESQAIAYVTPGTALNGCGNNTDTFYTFAQFQVAYPNFDNTNILGDPGVTNASIADSATPSVFDFRLTTGSAARDAGVASGAPPTDLAGIGRPTTPDIGAYEYFSNAISWAQVTPPANMPAYREWYRAVYDPVHHGTLHYLDDRGDSIYGNAMYLFNDDAVSPTFTLLWRGNGDGTTNPANCNSGIDWNATTPVARHPYYGMTWDSTNNSLWMIGGVCASAPMDLSHFWEFTHSGTENSGSWTLHATAHVPAASLITLSLAYDPVHDALWIVGGDTAAGYGQFAQTWVYCKHADPQANGDTIGCTNGANDWSQVTVTNGIGLAGEELFFNTHRNRLMTYGGYLAGGTHSNAIREYNAVAKTWDALSPTGTPPTVTGNPFAYAAWDSARLRLVVTVDATHQYIWDSPTNAWSAVSISGTAPVMPLTSDTMVATTRYNAYRDVYTTQAAQAGPTFTFYVGTPTGGGSPPSCAITPTSLGPWTVGQAPGTTFSQTGCGASSWSSTGTWPTGLTFSDGALSGTISAAGTFTPSVTYDTATNNYNITVNAAPAISTTTLPGVTSGQSYNQTLTVTGGTGSKTCSLASGSLTGSGLALNSNCTITGTAAAAATYTFTATATDGNSVTGAASALLSVTVSGGTAASGAGFTGSLVGGVFK